MADVKLGALVEMRSRRGLSHEQLFLFSGAIRRIMSCGIRDIQVVAWSMADELCEELSLYPARIHIHEVVNGDPYHKVWNESLQKQFEREVTHSLTFRHYKDVEKVLPHRMHLVTRAIHEDRYEPLVGSLYNLERFMNSSLCPSL